MDTICFMAEHPGYKGGIRYCYTAIPSHHPKCFFYMFVHYMLTIVANIFENKNNTKKDMWFIFEI